MKIACKLMEWNPLRLTKSFSFSCGTWILMWVLPTQAITLGNPPLVKKNCVCFDVSPLWSMATRWSFLVSVQGWAKLGWLFGAWFDFDKAWFRDVSLSRLSWRSSVKTLMDSRPKQNQLLNSSRVKSHREKSSGSLNVLSFLLGAGVKPKFCQAISQPFCFLWGKFSLDYGVNPPCHVLKLRIILTLG